MNRRATLALFAAISIVPLFLVRFLPFSDLPEHVATIAAFRHFHDPAARIAEHYEIAWGRSQYFLYHLTGAGLAYLVGSAEWANRLLLAVVGFSYPFAVRALLRALGRDERIALFACPLFFSHALVVGLLPFVASIPIVVFGLALVARQEREPARWRFVALSLLGILLLFAHVSALVVFAIAAVAMIATHAVETSSVRAVPRRAAWLVPSGVLLAVWLGLSRMGRLGGSIRTPGQVTFVRPRTLTRAFAFWSHDAWQSHVDEGLAIGFWIVVCAIAASAMILARRDAARAPRNAMLLAPLGAVLLLYSTLPFRVGATDSLNVRVGVFVPLFALLALDLRPGLHARIALVAATLLTLGSSANNAYEVVAAQSSLGDFDRVLRAMRPGSRLLTLTSRIDAPPNHFPPWLHAGAYHRARDGGVAEPSFATLGHWPLHFRSEVAPPAKSEAFWEFHPCLFRNAIDGRYYDYVLVFGDMQPFRDDPPGPVFRLVLREKDWTLYEKTAEENPAWTTEDEGPCVARVSAAPSEN